MSTDPVREATEKAILRERIMLHAMFAARPAALLERYFSETLLRGMPSDHARRDLAELLAEYGLADPDGRAPVTTHSREPDHEVAAAYKLAGLERRMTLPEFRAAYYEARREAVRPISAREFADGLARTTPSHAFSAPLRRGGVRVLSVYRGFRQKRS